MVFVERGQRKILVNYAKRQVGNKVYGGQIVAPAVEAQHVGRDPADLRLVDHPVPGDAASSWFGTERGHALAAGHRRRRCRPGQPIYVMLYAAAIIFFCFFYTALVFNPQETADNLKKSGAFIPGIRPGEQTARYIDKILTRLTLAGALYVTAGLPAAGVPDPEVERAVLLRRHVAADHRGGDDGLHGAGAGLHDVAPVREPAEEGEFQGRLLGRLR